MRKTLFCLILAAALTSCGSSNSTSLPGADGLNGNFISTTVDVEQHFLYSLNPQPGTVSGFVIAPEEEAEEGEEAEEPSPLELVPLDGSPFTLPGAAPIGMVIEGTNQSLFLLDASGTLRRFSIDGLTGQLSASEEVVAPVANARILRLSEGGDSLAVLGDDLVVYTIGEDGLSAPAFLDNTESWTDVRLSEGLGAGATATGAVGFRWSAGETIATTPEVALPGLTRGQLVYVQSELFVVNSSDASLSRLNQEEDGQLTLLETLALPPGLVDPQTICAILDGEQLLVGDVDSVALLVPSAGLLEDLGQVEIGQPPTTLFPVPDTEIILVGQEQGAEAVLAGEEGLEALDDVEVSEVGVSAFSYAQRVERITRVTTP